MSALSNRRALMLVFNWAEAEHFVHAFAIVLPNPGELIDRRPDRSGSP